MNVAMPVRLLVNEILTNSFKYAFNGRRTGTLAVQCLHEGQDNNHIVVADDGVGLPDGTTWSMPGKLSALIPQSLQENAKTEFDVERAPGKGTRMTISINHESPVKTSN